MPKPPPEPERAATSLRERQKARVLADIRRAGYQLITEYGYAEVTTESIASAAGVSLRTFFRYFTNKEDLLLGASHRRGSAISTLLEQRPKSEGADAALSHAILGHATSFDVDDIEEWRRAISTTPELLNRVTMIEIQDKDRILENVAMRMRTDASVDFRPGLLVHLAFSAGNYAFQQWVQRPDSGRGPLHESVAEALSAIRGRHWRPTAQN
jgi:AcrR family transcriptional regulator